MSRITGFNLQGNSTKFRHKRAGVMTRMEGWRKRSDISREKEQ